MLKKGGNAFDAAIAAAACLVVLEPQTNGAGSDAFAIFTQNGGKLQGMNSTGVMGRSFDLQKMRDKGYKEMPHYGFEPVTVPGAPAAWAAINEKYGRLPLTEVLAPAISYAREGQALCTITWSSINTMASRMRENTDCGPQFDEWFRIFMPGGEAPRPGQESRVIPLLWCCINLQLCLSRSSPDIRRVRPGRTKHWHRDYAHRTTARRIHRSFLGT